MKKNNKYGDKKNFSYPHIHYRIKDIKEILLYLA